MSVITVYYRRARVRYGLEWTGGTYAMMDILTDHARRMLHDVEVLAKATGCSDTRVGHILAVMLRDKRKNVAMAALHECGMTDEGHLYFAGSGAQPCSAGGTIDLPQFALVAVHEAQRLGDNYAGPEHLLFALLGTYSEQFRDYLQGYGVTLECVRDELHAILGIGSP